VATSPASPDHRIERVDGQDRASICRFAKKTLNYSISNPQSKETARSFEQWRGGGVPEQAAAASAARAAATSST
jgi:hypothetical protein